MICCPVGGPFAKRESIRERERERENILEIRWQHYHHESVHDTSKDVCIHKVNDGGVTMKDNVVAVRI